MKEQKEVSLEQAREALRELGHGECKNQNLVRHVRTFLALGDDWELMKKRILTPKEEGSWDERDGRQPIPDQVFSDLFWDRFEEVIDDGEGDGEGGPDQ